MRNILYVLCILSVILTITGCGEQQDETPLSGVTNVYDIQVSNTDFIALEVPAECVLQLTDNCTHYEFSNGTVIDLTNTQLTTAELDEESGLYVGKSSIQLNVDDKCIIVSCTGNVKEAMLQYLQQVKRYTVSTDLYKEYELKSLPDYNKMEMELVDNMYLPANTPRRNWLSLESWLYNEGTSYLQLTVYDYPLKDIKDRLMTQVLCNTGKSTIDEWWQSDDILYMRAGNNCIVTKRLAFNCTYVYSCHVDLLDYALQGADKVYGVKQ